MDARAIARLADAGAREARRAVRDGAVRRERTRDDARGGTTTTTMGREPRGNGAREGARDGVIPSRFRRGEECDERCRATRGVARRVASFAAARVAPARASSNRDDRAASDEDARMGFWFTTLAFAALEGVFYAYVQGSAPAARRSCVTRDATRRDATTTDGSVDGCTSERKDDDDD